MEYLNKLDQLEARYDDLTRQMADPAVINDSDRYLLRPEAVGTCETSERLGEAVRFGQPLDNTLSGGET